MKKILYLFIIAALAVSCQEKIPVTDIKLDKSAAFVALSGTITLTANLIPLSATNRDITWSSSNNRIATVTENSIAAAFSTGLVTGIAEGTVTITATSKSGNYTATCTITVVDAEPQLVSVEGGTFTMGCTFDDCNSTVLIPHQVTLNSYKIAKHQVTQKQWEAIMGDNPSSIKGDDLPVYYVSWHNAQTFITKLNSITGKKYRLPTEAEWEYAARGGNKSQGFKYSGSDNIDEVAWYSGNSLFKPHPVGTKKANELGTCDMSGNMVEWCSDWWDLYTDASQENPTGPDNGEYRIVRGGDYGSSAIYAHVTWRGGIKPNSEWGGGFRLAHP